MAQPVGRLTSCGEEMLRLATKGLTDAQIALEIGDFSQDGGHLPVSHRDQIWM